MTLPQPDGWIAVRNDFVTLQFRTNPESLNLNLIGGVMTPPYIR